jgi:hypothetical protein
MAAFGLNRSAEAFSPAGPSGLDRGELARPRVQEFKSGAWSRDHRHALGRLADPESHVLSPLSNQPRDIRDSAELSSSSANSTLI